MTHKPEFRTATKNQYTQQQRQEVRSGTILATRDGVIIYSLQDRPPEQIRILKGALTTEFGENLLSQDTFEHPILKVHPGSPTQTIAIHLGVENPKFHRLVTAYSKCYREPVYTDALGDWADPSGNFLSNTVISKVIGNTRCSHVGLKSVAEIPYAGLDAVERGYLISIIQANAKKWGVDPTSGINWATEKATLTTGGLEGFQLDSAIRQLREQNFVSLSSGTPPIFSPR